MRHEKGVDVVGKGKMEDTRCCLSGDKTKRSNRHKGYVEGGVEVLEVEGKA